MTGHAVEASTTPVVGMLGGMSWESSALYYRLLNEAVNERLGRHHNARSVLYSFDFDELLSWADADEWGRVSDSIAAGARVLEQAGVTFLMITSVTGHASADAVSSSADVPLLHIVDPLAKALQEQGIERIGLIGTRFTMEKDFLRSRLQTQHGIDVVIPGEADRAELHRIIMDELTLGQVTATARETVVDASRRLIDDGAQAIVVACTELPLLLAEEDYPAPAFDAARLHVEAAVELLVARNSSQLR